MGRHLRYLICAALALFAAPGLAFGAGARVHIDRVVTSDFRERGILRIYADITDSRGQVVESLKPEDVRFEVDGTDQLGRTTVTNVQAIGEGTAVMIVLPAYQAFVAGELGSKAFDQMVAGARTVIKRLGQQDHVAVVTYTEEGYDIRHPFSKDAEAAVKDLEDFARDLERKEPTDKPEPPKLLSRYLPWLLANGFKAENLPERRVLLLLTAGHDDTVEKRTDSRIAAKVDQLVRTAQDTAVGPPRKVYVVGIHGFTERDHLAPFRGLAERTGGTYYGCEFSEDFDEIDSGLVATGELILKQPVVAWEPQDWRGGRATIRMNVNVKGTVVYDDVERKWPERPFPWLKAVLIGLGGVAGLVLLVMIGRGIAGAAARRREQAEPEPEPLVMPGGTRAVLHIMSGPHAGEEAWLSREVTTMGKSDGCDIAFADAKMSRRHAAIRIDDMRFELSDLKSTNGTLVNGRRVEKVFLKDGDHILMGETTVAFKLVR